jgi:hypothetical protein
MRRFNLLNDCYALAVPVIARAVVRMRTAS